MRRASSLDATTANWLPFTFRWYFLVLTILSSLAFGIALLSIVFYSQRHQGIGTDDGTSIILFGWRFAPTLLAVLFTQLTVILFEDAKRTEPFARLAMASEQGTNAQGTVLQRPRAWWTILSNALFKRKSLGKTSWCLLCSTLVNSVALLLISPLSSALLTSEAIAISKPLEFSRFMPKTNTQLPLLANRETYFRTISSLMSNVSTSAWIGDTILTLPIWPSTDEVQLGPNLSSNYSTWMAETRSLYADLKCQNMTLESANLESKNYSARGISFENDNHNRTFDDRKMYNGTVDMVTFLLKSDDGCRYEVSSHPSGDLAYNGGLTWSNTSTYIFESAGCMKINGILFCPQLDSTNPYIRYNASAECMDRDIIIVNTPWTKPALLDWWITTSNDTIYTSDQPNITYERSPDFRMRGIICESEYTVMTEDMTVSLASGQQPVMDYSTNKQADQVTSIDSFVDIPSFQETFLQGEWEFYFWGDSIADDTTSSGQASKNINSSEEIPNPLFKGPGSVLGAIYSFNITAMLDDRHFANQAARSKGRFFTECLREAVDDPNVMETGTTDGKVTITEQRVLVLPQVGIIMAILFFMSSLSLMFAFWSSRLRRRPLNLYTDPGSTIGHGLLYRPQVEEKLLLRGIYDTTLSEFHETFRSYKFYTTNGTLHTKYDAKRDISSKPISGQTKYFKIPISIRIRVLCALSALLIAILVGVLVMNTFSNRSHLTAPMFTYEADVSKFHLGFQSFAPISIVPTIISIVIGLWWDQLDTQFRVLQPYIAMSRRPTPISRSSGLTYRSKTWAGAAFKAARNRHWLLCLIAVGSVLCQILTVSMSALFENQVGDVTRPLTLERTLRIRQLPMITQIDQDQGPYPENVDLLKPDDIVPNIIPRSYAFEALSPLLLDPPRNWLSNAAIQLSLNGTKIPWTFDGWNFIPQDLASPIAQVLSIGTNQSTITSTSNVTMSTAAIRARLECDSIPEIANTSSWITHPEQCKVCKAFFPEISKEYEDYYVLDRFMFNGTQSNTTVFANTKLIQCCGNGTSDDPQKALVGYWSPVDAFDYPFLNSEWPRPFVTKWIVGTPVALTDQTSPAPFHDRIVLYKEIPAIQAARCMPVIETTNARIIVDANTGIIHSYNITDPVLPAESAWSDSFVLHDPSTSQLYSQNYSGPLNLTTSYGVLFMDSIFNAPDAAGQLHDANHLEALYDNSFSIRDLDSGLNMDLLTYSMYALVNKDSDALLDYSTLVKHADYTFQTFFQHFVNYGLSLSKGGLAYQNMNDTKWKDLGPAMDINGTLLPPPQTSQPIENPTADAWVTRRIPLLHLNTTATYLTIVILIWLISTVLIVACLQRKYTGSLIRNVEVIADVLVLIAGSDNLLKLIRERGVELKRSEDIMTKLGWFKDRRGEVRWGVEVVGGENAVEWVHGPNEDIPR